MKNWQEEFDQMWSANSDWVSDKGEGYVVLDQNKIKDFIANLLEEMNPSNYYDKFVSIGYKKAMSDVKKFIEKKEER